MRVGMFDSGIGGLTVLKSFLKHHPNNEYVYYGDTLNMPYGDKSKEELLNLAKKIIEFLQSKNVDIIVIACGTVSSNIYNELKEFCKVPIYNIISEVKDYILKREYKKVLVMATSATVSTHVFKNMNQEIINEVACPKLVPLIENNKLDLLDEVLDEYIDKKEDYDAIILGCTHYSIIKEKIKNKMNSNTEIIELGEIVAKNIKLKESNKNLELYFSKEMPNLSDNINKILLL